VNTSASSVAKLAATGLPVVSTAAAARPSFDDFVVAHSPEFQRFAYLVTGSSEDARDAVQDALLGVFRKWEDHIRPDEATAYVRRSIANAHVSAWRKRRREHPQAEIGDFYDQPIADLAGPVCDADQARKLLAGLPRRQRAALVLRYWEDRPYRDIAEVCGCSEQAARRLVTRGLAALRARLGGT
jgi:RNA polymerase sigma factor (sigma-70 family)